MAPDAAHSAVFLDGRSNRKSAVALRLGAALDIIEGDAAIESWPYDAVRRADGPPRMLRLSCVSALPLARLEIADAATQGMVAAYCKSLDTGRAAAGQTWRIVFWSLAAVCSILLLAFYGIPFAADRLAPVIPSAIEQRIGGAIDKLKRAGGMETALDAQVLSSKIPNAFALPGGKIYLLDGLLQKANNVDEVAGVLAHELGHVTHHDNLRRIIQTGGTSFLVGLLFGDVTGGAAMVFVGRSLFDASYSRDAERAADAFAIEVMRRLGRSPKPLGDLLVRVTGTESGKSVTLLSSHPMSEERLATMSKETPANSGPEILSATEWKALKGICATR